MFKWLKDIERCCERLDKIEKCVESKQSRDFGCVFPVYSIWETEGIYSVRPEDSLIIGDKEICLNGVMYDRSCYFPPNETSWNRAVSARYIKNNKEKKNGKA